MSQVTLTQISNAVRDTLRWSNGIARAMSPADLKEGIPDVALLQVYPENWATAVNSNTDRTTFKAGVRHSEVVFHIDVYAKVRANIGEDMDKVLQLTDAVITRLELQTQKPYFGLEGIKAFKWTGERVTFAYGDPQTSYAGSRFTLTFDLF